MLSARSPTSPDAQSGRNFPLNNGAGSMESGQTLHSGLGSEVGGLIAPEWDDVVDSMPHFNHEHQFRPGTIGYTAEKLADNIAGAFDTMQRISRRSSSAHGLHRATSEELHNTANTGALSRARRALGRATSRHTSRDDLGGTPAASAPRLNHMSTEGLRVDGSSSSIDEPSPRL